MICPKTRKALNSNAAGHRVTPRLGALFRRAV